MKRPIQEIAADVHALGYLKQLTGFQTRRAVVDILQDLTPQELLQVSKIVTAMSVKGAVDQ